jgi:hypothetical protein
VALAEEGGYVHFFVLVRVVALVLASGSSVLVAAGGWSEAVLLFLEEKGRSADDLLVYLFVAATYTLAAIAALHGLAFWLDTLG